jgi:hypothetical protein
MLGIVDWDAVKRTAEEAIESIRAMPYEPSRDLKAYWPSGWCEWASVSIAEALSARGLGEWTFVQASRPDEPNGHAWLELRDADGAVLYSIDATIHQFPGHDAPYVGPGRTPSAREFTRVNYDGPWRDWPPIRRDTTFQKCADETWLQMNLGTTN